MVEITKPVKGQKPYKPKWYKTPQLEFADLVEYKANDIFLADQFYPLLNRWTLINEIRPTIDLPIRYSPERRQFELLKKPVWTEAGALKVSPVTVAIENYEVNPTSATAGYVVLDGVAAPVETFTTTVSRVDIFAKDNNFYIKIQKPDGSWLPIILLRGEINQAYSFDMVCNAVTFRNVVTDGTANGSYQVIGWR